MGPIVSRLIFMGMFIFVFLILGIVSLGGDFIALICENPECVILSVVVLLLISIVLPTPSGRREG